MKRLLFIMDNFPLGGISKSLLALFNEIEDKYDIDFLLMEKKGIFLPLIPERVNVITRVIEEEFRSPHPKNVFRYFKTLSYNKWIQWCGYSLRCSIARLTGGLHKFVNTMDVYIAKHSIAINKHYNAAIAYQGGRCIYYLVEKVNADIKIGYVHSNYTANPTDYMLKPSDAVYFPKLDHIATISQVCLESLWKEFPSLKKKSIVIENICSPKMICNLAEQGDTYSDGFKGIRLVSMGRFDIEIKGMDLAIEACKQLKEKKMNFRWYWLGEGDQRLQLEKMIEESAVEDVFMLLGAKTNPYPFVKDADVYIQPSRIEGKSVALDEVKALRKPIVVTKFASVYDQFENGVNAVICEINAKTLSDSIFTLINNKDMQDKLRNNLINEKVGNEEQADIFRSLIEKKIYD